MSEVKDYFKLVFMPLLSMAAGLAMLFFMVFWIQHECYNEYLENSTEIVVKP